MVGLNVITKDSFYSFFQRHNIPVCGSRSLFDIERQTISSDANSVGGVGLSKFINNLINGFGILETNFDSNEEAYEMYLFLCTDITKIIRAGRLIDPAE